MQRKLLIQTLNTLIFLIFHDLFNLFIKVSWENWRFPDFFCIVISHVSGFITVIAYSDFDVSISTGIVCIRATSSTHHSTALSAMMLSYYCSKVSVTWLTVLHDIIRNPICSVFMKCSGVSSKSVSQIFHWMSSSLLQARWIVSQYKALIKCISVIWVSTWKANVMKMRSSIRWNNYSLFLFI